MTDRVICGNDPHVRMTPGDRAVVDWFGEWLAWANTPVDQRGPEPATPDGHQPATGPAPDLTPDHDKDTQP